MGDVAMLVPVIRALLLSNPDVRITLLTRTFFKPLFEEFQNVTVMEADVSGRHKGLIGLRNLSKEIKASGIEAVADCHDVLRTNILKVFLRQYAFYQIDKGRKEKKALTKGKLFQQLKTTHSRYADVFRRMGFEINLDDPVFPPRPGITSRAVSLLGEYSTLVGIAPFAAYPSKEYPLDKLEKVLKELSKDWRLLLFGSELDRDRLDQVASKHENVINLAGKLTFEEELKVIRNLNLMISMDSGNAHLAAAYGVNTVTLWGVTHPYAGFAPFNQDSGNALLADRSIFTRIPTSIYGNRYPKEYLKAIATIDHNDIVKKARQIIRNQTSS